MKSTMRKSDFALAPYMKSSNLRATYQILSTVVPYMMLWVLAIQAADISIWLLPPIIILISLFSVRCFSLMHDCGHYSLFSSRWANRSAGFLLGVINAIPQYSWSRDHAYHHKTNGDWERYRGVADFLSTEEFAKLSPFDQQLYEILRHPLMAIPGGFFYLAIKPRLALVTGIYDLVRHLFTNWKRDTNPNLAAVLTAHQSKHWQSAAEFWDLLFNNMCVLGIWVGFGYLLGFGVFFSIYSITLTLAAVIFIWVFFVQHIFDGSYAHKTAGWDYLAGAVTGSSYLELPAVLKWFTADIGYHNIHHLSERIPNYHLEACHQANAHLLSQVKKLRIVDMPSCAKFILWDAEADCLVSIATFRQTGQSTQLDAEAIPSVQSVSKAKREFGN